MPTNEVATRLRALMEYRNIQSYLELAELCGTTASAVGNWFNGCSTPRVANMIQLREATGISLDWIYCGAGEMPAKAE